MGAHLQSFSWVFPTQCYRPSQARNRLQKLRARLWLGLRGSRKPKIKPIWYRLTCQKSFLGPNAKRPISSEPQSVGCSDKLLWKLEALMRFSLYIHFCTVSDKKTEYERTERNRENSTCRNLVEINALACTLAQSKALGAHAPWRGGGLRKLLIVPKTSVLSNDITRFKVFILRILRIVFQRHPFKKASYQLRMLAFLGHLPPGPPFDDLLIHQTNAIKLIPTGDPVLMDVVWSSLGPFEPTQRSRA